MATEVSQEEQERALRLCSEHLGGIWKDLEINQVNITRVCGGMTNLLYLCALLDCDITPKLDNNNKSNHHSNHDHHSVPSELQHEPKQVLLRIYGPSHSDTEIQLEIFQQLANENLGPRLYGTFDEGRLEEYFPSRPLLSNEMINKEVFGVVANRIASIQMLNVKSLTKSPNWLLDRYREYYGYVIEAKRAKSSSSSSSSTTVVSEQEDDRLESTRIIAKELCEIDFNLEINFLETLFKQSKAPLVFSHNDLHQNNILLLNQDKDLSLEIEDRIVLIDFEYCSYNYRTFDAANFLSEWCFDYNGDKYPYFSYSLDRFPTDEEQREFLTYFAKSLYKSSSNMNHNDQPQLDAEISSCKNNCANGGPSNGHFESEETEMEFSSLDKTVELLYDEMQPFLLASNLLWTIWAIKSAFTSKIKFGYWEMAKAKYKVYLLCKEKFLNRSKKIDIAMRVFT